LQDKLLNPAHGGGRLPKYLDVPDLTDADLLIKVLLPLFDSLPEAHSDRALDWVVSRWDTLKLNEELCTALSRTRFVTAGENLFWYPF
jgi:hypothetical protein